MGTPNPQSFQICTDLQLAARLPATRRRPWLESRAPVAVEKFDELSAAEHEMNGESSRTVAPELAMRQAVSGDLSVVVQLVEAACRARDGDHEATKAHIAHAVRLLQRALGSGPAAARVPSGAERQAPSGGLPAWQVRRVIAHIEANLSRKIPVRELAQLLGLSTSHFSRAFKETLRASPSTYVLRRRIEVAQGLMLTSSEPLCSIALACGMFDQAHFTRSFQRLVGETPRSWRRTRLGALRVDEFRRRAR